MNLNVISFVFNNLTFWIFSVPVADLPVRGSIFSNPEALQMQNCTRVDDKFTVVALRDLPYLVPK